MAGPDSPESAEGNAARAHALPRSLSVLKRFERRPENVIGGELRRPCLSEASSSYGNKGGSLGYRFSRLLQIPLE